MKRTSHFFIILISFTLLHFSCTEKEIINIEDGQSTAQLAINRGSEGPCEQRRDVDFNELLPLNPFYPNPLPFSEQSLIGELDRVANCDINNGAPICTDPNDPSNELTETIIVENSFLIPYCTEIDLCNGIPQERYAPLFPSIFTVATQDEIIQAAKDFAHDNIPCDLGVNSWVYIEYDFFDAGFFNCGPCGSGCDPNDSCAPYGNFSFGVYARITCCPGL